VINSRQPQSLSCRLAVPDDSIRAVRVRPEFIASIALIPSADGLSPAWRRAIARGDYETAAIVGGDWAVAVQRPAEQGSTTRPINASPQGTCSTRRCGLTGSPPSNRRSGHDGAATLSSSRFSRRPYTHRPRIQSSHPTCFRQAVDARDAVRPTSNTVPHVFDFQRFVEIRKSAAEE